MTEVQTVQGKNGVAKVFTSDVDEGALKQVEQMMNEPITEDSVVRIMPDVHIGMGSTIGTTILLEDHQNLRVSPNVVGVDIGCGIKALKLAPGRKNLKDLDRFIARHVPSGFKTHRRAQDGGRVKEWLRELHTPLTGKEHDRIVKSLGTLGGGNHYIEVAEDETGAYWLSVHSGSRNLGVQVCRYHQKIADTYWDNQGGPASEKPKIPYLVGRDVERYLHDMRIAQKYARENRRLMLQLILDGLGWEVASGSDSRIDSPHNYIDFREDDIIIRKGATSARDGEQFLIPINMRDGTLICVGKGEADWNYSAPHGAGRRLSRTQARRELHLKEYRHQMKDVYTTSVHKKTLDEAPGAYKPLHNLLDNMEDTADVIHHLKPVYNYKAH